MNKGENTKEKSIYHCNLMQFHPEQVIPKTCDVLNYIFAQLYKFQSHQNMEFSCCKSVDEIF